MKLLHSNMKKQQIKKAKFQSKINGIIFNNIFFIDSIPYKLAIGVRDKNLYFEIPVSSEFTIRPYLGDKYGEICKILGLKYDKNNPYSPKKFFESINIGIPSKVCLKDVPLPHEIAPYRSHVNQPEKIYFKGWWDNDLRGEKVQESNLEKTRALLDEEAYKMCKKHNMSSQWSDKSTDEKMVTSFWKNTKKKT
nr:DUF6037 family protein [Planococcus sp. MSAK28401]